MTSLGTFKVAVIGTGYVGLTTGACLAKLGHEVICADILPEKVASLQAGIIPILEEGLEELVQDGLANKRLKFVLGAKQAVRECDFAFMCVPTPQSETGAADLSYLLTAASEIGPELPKGAIVINKSTVPIQSAERVAQVIGRPDIFVASNPEFLREGRAVYDSFNPSRIVIGAATEQIAQRVALLYTKLNAPKLLVNTSTAELIKYASNAFLATKISFANSISNLSEAVGANAHYVLRGMGFDERIGKQFMKPGPGWGGSCFPKDTYALVHMAEEAGYDFDLLKSVITTNDMQTELVIRRTSDLLGGNVKGANVAAWGLTFKAGTDDTRQSPALRILNDLTRQGASVRAYDPAVTANQNGIEICDTALGACDEADILLVLTEWPQFGDVPLKDVSTRLRHKRLIDTRNIIDLNLAKTLSFRFWSVGYGNL
jgi:UDPglucose 6-dehydrogenase